MKNFDVNNKIQLSLAVLTTLAASGWRSHADTINPLSEWSIITSGNLANVSDFYGNAYVGGSLTVQNSFNAAINDTDVMPAGNVSLAVAGNITTQNPSQVNAGNVVVGGTISGQINVNGGGTITQGNSSALPSSPVAQVANASQSWSTQAANSTASTSPNSPLVFNCSSTASLAVFNISASTLFAQNQQLDLVLAAATKQVLINVSGFGAVSQNSSQNFEGDFVKSASSVVFNFYQASSVTFTGEAYGYMVAPEATVSSGSPIVGGVMAETLDTTSEVEMRGTPDYIAPSVPETGAAGPLLGLALAGLAVIRRRCGRR